MNDEVDFINKVLIDEYLSEVFVYKGFDIVFVYNCNNYFIEFFNILCFGGMSLYEFILK